VRRAVIPPGIARCATAIVVVVAAVAGVHAVSSALLARVLCETPSTPPGHPPPPPTRLRSKIVPGARGRGGPGGDDGRIDCLGLGLVLRRIVRFRI
jgi:hypothetical protein